MICLEFDFKRSKVKVTTSPNMVRTHLFKNALFGEGISAYCSSSITIMILVDILSQRNDDGDDDDDDDDGGKTLFRK